MSNLQNQRRRNTKDRGLKLQPEDADNKWRIRAYSDSDFAGDKETRISDTGYIYLFYECTYMLALTWTERG